MKAGEGMGSQLMGDHSRCRLVPRKKPRGGGHHRINRAVESADGEKNTRLGSCGEKVRNIGAEVG